MKFRVFTRKAAHAVQPGETIEAPKPMIVEEVTNRVDGLKLVGRRPHMPDSHRVSAEVDRDDPVDLPVTDTASVSSLLADAFGALAAAVRDDDITAADPGWFEWERDGHEFRVFTAGRWLTIAPVADEPVSRLEPVPSGEGSAPAE